MISASLTLASTARQRLPLNAPQSPRSEEITTMSARSTSRLSRSGWAASSESLETSFRMDAVRSAYPRKLVAASWARLSLAAETIFMARVIFCVF